MNKLIAVLILLSSLASHAEWGIAGPVQKFLQPIALGLASILRAQQTCSQHIHETAQRLQRQERTLQWLHIDKKVEFPTDDLPILGWNPQSLQEDPEQLPSEIERLHSEMQNLKMWDGEGLLSKAEEHRLDFCRRQLEHFFKAEVEDASVISFDSRLSGLSNIPGICQLTITPQEAAAAFPGILLLPDAPSDAAAAATDEPEDGVIDLSATSRYFIVKELGRGSYGVAFLVTRATDGKQFVAKVVRTPTAHYKAYVDNEVACLRKCDHFAIIELLESYKSGCTDYGLLIAEFANAGDLKTRLENRELMGERGHILAQLILSLHHVHQHNILHRDIKSANIFLTDNGLVKLGDFGFSQQFNEVSQKKDRGRCGTPNYLAPELWPRQATCNDKADIWSMGVLFYEIIAGRRPFVANNPRALGEQVLSGAYPALPEACNDALRFIIGSMIQQTPDRRPNTSDLIQYPYARRLIAEFKAHVSNPALFRSDDPNERERILRDINSAIPPEAMAAPIVAKPAIRYARATILNTDGDWKTRFVALNGAGISIGLTLEMNADQSKSYPLPRIATVTARGTYILAIYFKSHGGQILTQFDSTEERNEWVEVLNLALRGQAPPQPT